MLIFGRNKAISLSKPDKVGQLIYRFDDFSFDAERLELRKNGEPVTLRVQPARLLKVLLEQAPEMVTRQTLQERIWDQGTVVEFDLGLNTCVNQLRSSLGDSGSSPRYVETLPKRGYRFIPTVSTRQSRKPLPGKKWIVMTSVIVLLASAVMVSRYSDNTVEEPKSVFVAPVQIDLDEHAEIHGMVQYALRLGTVETLQNHNLDVLRIINGDSLWKDIEQARSMIDADFSLFMTLGMYNNELRLEALLVESAKKAVNASNTFPLDDLDVASLVRLSDQVSHWSSKVLGVSSQESVNIIDEFKPGYFDAMVRAKRALNLIRPVDLQVALDWFNRALEINPTSIEAKGGKALALAVLSGSPGYPVASTYQSALLLADEIRQAAGPTAHSELVRGFIFLYHYWDLPSSRDALDLAVTLAPGDALTHAWRAAVLAAQGKTGEAAMEADLAVSLDPVSTAINGDRCWYLGAAGRYGDAVSACEVALEIEPGHLWSQISLATALEQLGKQQDALQALITISESLKARRDGVESQSVSRESVSYTRDVKGLNCEIADMLAPAAASQTFPLTRLAAFNARCGRLTEAAELLSEARRGGESGVLFYAVDPHFEAFRSLESTRNLDMSIQVREM